MNTYNYVFYILLILIVCVLTTNIEGFNGSVYNIHCCEDNTQNFMKQELISYGDNNMLNRANIHIPCNYAYTNKNISDTLNKINTSNTSNNYISWYPHCFNIGYKNKLWSMLRNQYDINEAATIMPMSYDMPKDYSALISNHNSNKSYILKKNCHRQKGLEVTTDVNKVVNYRDDGYIVAQDMIDVYRFNHNGKDLTFNLRVYYLIYTLNGKTYHYVHDDGIISYSSDGGNIASFYNKDLYEKGLPITTQKFKDNILPDLDWKTIDDKITQNIFKIGKAFNKKYMMNLQLLDRVNYFQVFGVDVVIDKKMNPYIVEINVGPGMDPHNEEDKRMRKRLHKEILRRLQILID